MATHKHIDAICIGITVFTLLLTVLFLNGSALGIQAAAREETGDALFTENDLDAAWDTANATTITLSDEGSTVDGNGAYVYDGDVHIVYAGRYVLSGALSDGSVIIEADGDDKIWLMLSDTSIHCEDDAALRVEQAGKVFLTLQGENALSSGSAYSEAAVSAGVDGVLYSRDDLTVNGSGSLQVTAEYQHGIVCNDDFVVTGGTLTVTAAQDAIHANDSVRIKDADLTLSAGDDGITVSNDDETAFLYVESGHITIPSCREGLEAVQITVAGGTLEIAAADDGLNANGYGGTSVINITGGDLTVTVADGRDADGLDSNKDLYISGGRLLISVSDSSCAIDYGSEYGGKCEISGGTVLACGSSGMAEGFDASSPQGFVMQSVSAAAGTTVTLRDAEGDELLSETVPCSFSSVLVSTPELKVGDSCTLVVGDTETELTVDNSQLSGWGGGRGIRGGRFGDFADGTQPGGDGKAGGMQPPDGTDGGQTPPDLPQDGTDGGQVPPDLPQDGTGGGQMPPDLPQGGTGGGQTPPNMPQDETDGSTPTDLPQGIPNAQQNGAFGELPSDLQGGDFAGRRDGGKLLGFGTERESAPQASDAESSVPAEAPLLLAVSAVVLLCGCVAALLYKRKR